MSDIHIHELTNSVLPAGLRLSTSIALPPEKDGIEFGNSVSSLIKLCRNATTFSITGLTFPCSFLASKGKSWLPPLLEVEALLHSRISLPSLQRPHGVHQSSDCLALLLPSCAAYRGVPYPLLATFFTTVNRV